MPLVIAPIDASFGATLTSVDLADLDDATWSEIEEAFDTYAMLVFPAQNLSDEAQSNFGMRFGDIEQLVAGMDLKTVALSNQNPDGSLIEPDSHLFQTLRGNEGWHTDSSYMPLASKVAMLSAQIVPAEGGETEWADMRAAYDALDAKTIAQIEDLSAYHSLYQSQADAGFTIETGAGYGYHTKGAPLRPLVKEHPVTGRKSLFIGRHAYNIPGMEPQASKALLTKLLEDACQAPRTYKHKWTPGDLVVWDNRCVLHRARPYDTSQPRIVRTTRIAGDPATELVETGPDPRAAGFQPSASNT
jgi:alpha-ketoglutarate-dependent taurine dioxygenase